MLMREPAPRRKAFVQLFSSGKLVKLIGMSVVVALLAGVGVLARWGSLTGGDGPRKADLTAGAAASNTTAPPAAPLPTSTPTKEYIYAGSRLVAIEEPPAVVTTPTNPIDDAEFFVKQHYRDFLNREGDASGIAFWTNEIRQCNGDPICIEVKRINVSTAFFLSIEFQNTGYLLFRFNRETFFNTLPRFAPFIADAQRLGTGVVVGQPGWQDQLEANKQAFALEWVQRPEFIALFPTSMSPSQFVDQLFANAEVTPTADERNTAINAYGVGGAGGRAAALRNVADTGSVYNKQYNPAFVLMQYFGYLRRNPDDFPDTDLTGFNFWLTKLNSFSLPGEDVRNPDVASARVARAEMVKAFITSTEYRDRFGKALAPAFVSKMTAGATTVKAGTITSTFYSVASDGAMTVAQANPWVTGLPPAGYTFYRDVAFNVSATAAVTAPYTVTFDIAWEVSDPTEFAALRVLHMENGVWVDRTVLSPDAPAPDFVNRKISARANTLGTFAIGRLISANHAPVVSITQPVSGEVMQSPASFNLNANASDADGNLTKVQFYQGDTLLGEDSVAPYSFPLASLGAGNYAFRAKAIDSKGASTFSVYSNITVINPPAPTGSLSAVPGQINVCDGSGLGVANLSWTSSGTSTISLRAGAPNGTELTSGGPTGSFTTAKTIDDGTTLYMQNTTGGMALTSANTLATMSLRVTSDGCGQSGRTNFALAAKGGVATASSTYPNGAYPPSKAINGERKGANWGSTAPDGGGWNEATGQSAHWLQVDFTNGSGGASYKNIDEIDLFSVQDQVTTPVEPTEGMIFNTYGLVDFDLQYWTGAAWANIPTDQVRGNNKVWRKVTFTPVTTNKIRVWINRAADGMSRVVELEAWGRAASDTVWVEDGLPAGAGVVGDQEGWNWVSANPAPFSGASAHQSNLVAGMHQHYFYDATQGLRVNAGDSLFTYVYLDPANIPSAMMLQWYDGTWEHRAYWGADALNWGFADTESRRYMGAMPPAGQWIRLEVPASMVGLEGRTLTGMAFTLIDGRATWDRAGKSGFNRRNVALASNGATATASSIYGTTFPAASVINGDRKGLPWGSGGGWNDGTVNTWPDWLQVDFPAAKTINEIDVFTIQDNYANPTEPTETQTFTTYGNTSFRVQFWNGATWVTVPGGTVTGNSNVWRRFAFPSVTTSKIRVMVDDAADHGYSRLTEVEAYEPIANQPPVSQPAGPYAASAGTTLLFNGSNSSDPDGQIVSYSWNFGDGTFGSGANPPHAYASAGAYTVTLTVVDSAGDTASAQTTANITAPATNGATFISQSFPSSVVAGRAYYASITMRNTGTSTWSTSGNYSLGSQNPQDNLTWGMARVALPGTIAPGADATFILSFVAPSTPGTYNFQWRMVQDNVGWFGASTANQTVVVKAPTAPSAVALAAYWKFDEGSGVTASDATGNGNTGTLVSGPTWSTGKAGALSFDGVDDRVTIASNSTLNDIANNFTVSFWAYPRSTHQIDAEGYTWGGTSGQRYAFAPVYGPGNDAGAGISVGTNGVSVYEHSGNYLPASLVYQGTLSGWTHIVVVYENKQPKLYINGTLVRTGLTSSRANVILHPQDIGGMTYGYFDGVIDEVRVYNQVISASDVQTLASESQFVSQSVPVTMTAGQTYPVTVTMKNLGATNWTSADSFTLGTQNPQDNTTWGSTALGNGRVSLPATVIPGGDATFTFNVTAPSTPGTYNFQRQMVRGTSGWFGDVTPNVAVTVTAPAPSATATFVKSDATTKGNWQGVYGNDGYRLAGEAAFFPSYAQITTSGRNDYTWAATTADVRALQKASNGADRIASCWYNGTEFYVNVDVTDGWPHQVALYSLDWDGNNGRQQRIDVLDVATGTVLDSRALTAYSGGQYLVWNVKGSVTFRVTNTGSTASNAVVSGLFLDTPPTAQWKFDEGSGITAADASGNGNTGTLQGNPPWSAGKIGAGSLNFDGLDDRVSIANSASLSAVSNNFTVSFWANPRSTHQIDPESVTGVAGVGGQRWAIEPINKADPNAGAGISVGTNGVSVYEHAGGYMPATLVYPATLSGWTHIAVVYENKRPRLYINGLPVRVGLTSPRANVFIQPPEIGGMSYGYFDGQMDDVRIYNQPLDTAQIQHLAQGSPLKNLALGRPATQSSNFPNTTANVSADRAVDGNTDGNSSALSITHTNNDNQARWEVDLGYPVTIQNISLWNRTDCCSTRLSNFYVFVSDVPFTATDTSVQNQPGVWTYVFSGAAGTQSIIPVNRTGRYVRVQLSGLGYLTLAEVQVWGMPKNGPVFGDDFNDNALDWSKWSTFDPATPTTLREQNQRLEIALQPNVTGYNGVISSTPQSLINRNAQVEAVQTVSMGGWVEQGFKLARDSSNFYYMGPGAGSFVMDAWTNGVRDRTIINFDPVNHRFWRIQHDPISQTVSFMLSADGQNWAVGKTVAVTFPLNSMTVWLYAGAWGTGNGAPGTAYYDNLRIVTNGPGSIAALEVTLPGMQLAASGAYGAGKPSFSLRTWREALWGAD